VNPDFSDMLSALNAEGVEYLVVGGYALAVHGWPRATKDIDVWVRPTPENARRAFRALARFGAPLQGVAWTDLSREGVVLQIGVAPNRIDVLTRVEGLTFDEAWPGRVLGKLGGVQFPVLGRTDLIRNKRAVGRRTDLDDADRLEGLPPPAR
jgi:hypothetical protein